MFLPSRSPHHRLSPPRAIASPRSRHICSSPLHPGGRGPSACCYCLARHLTWNESSASTCTLQLQSDLPRTTRVVRNNSGEPQSRVNWAPLASSPSRDWLSRHWAAASCRPMLPEACIRATTQISRLNVVKPALVCASCQPFAGVVAQLHRHLLLLRPAPSCSILRCSAPSCLVVLCTAATSATLSFCCPLPETSCPVLLLLFGSLRPHFVHGVQHIQRTNCSTTRRLHPPFYHSVAALLLLLDCRPFLRACLSSPGQFCLSAHPCPLQT